MTQWFDVVVFTASMEVYGAAVTDKLEAHASFFKGRYFRHVCLHSLVTPQIQYLIQYLQSLHRPLCFS